MVVDPIHKLCWRKRRVVAALFLTVCVGSSAGHLWDLLPGTWLMILLPVWIHIACIRWWWAFLHVWCGWHCILLDGIPSVNRSSTWPGCWCRPAVWQCRLLSGSFCIWWCHQRRDVCRRWCWCWCHLYRCETVAARGQILVGLQRSLELPLMSCYQALPVDSESHKCLALSVSPSCER